MVNYCTPAEAEEMWLVIKKRLAKCILKLYLEKEKIVYCKGEKRDIACYNKEFDFFHISNKNRKNLLGKMKFMSGSEEASRKVPLAYSTNYRIRNSIVDKIN